MSDQKGKGILGQEKGAAAVEFAVALIALFGFFAIFMQIVLFYIAEERLSFAGYAAARTYAVEGSGPAIQAAMSIEPHAAIMMGGNQLLLTTAVPVPEGIADYVSGGADKVKIRHVSPLFKEPEYRDDNPDPL